MCHFTGFLFWIMDQIIIINFFLSFPQNSGVENVPS